MLDRVYAGRHQPSSSSTEPASAPKKVPDIVTGMPLDRDTKPWQYQRYNGSTVWQGAALRRRTHARRTNVSLGTCSVDLSGPHEPTPRPGGHVNNNPCRYFLVLTVRPDKTAVIPEWHPPLVIEPRTPPLYYAALLSHKGEATEQIKLLMAQINNDHASFPTEVIFRLHSDQGGEFMSNELIAHCANLGIHKTSTVGYDPNSNSAEGAVNLLKQ